MLHPRPVFTLLTMLVTVACSAPSDESRTTLESRAVEAPPAVGPEADGTISVRAGLRAAYITAVQEGAGLDYRFTAPSSEEPALATNPAQGFSTEIAHGALRVRPASAESGWALELRWTGVGRGDRLEPVEPPAGPGEVLANRASYHRPGIGEEWYLNGPLGIEHGFALTEPPAASPGPRVEVGLSLELSVAGGLVPTTVVGVAGPGAPGADGSTVALRTASGKAVLHYSELYVTDTDGQPLRARFEVDGQRILIRIDDRGARYPLRVDPLVWFERSELVPIGSEVGDCYGLSAVIDGDTVLVGAPGFLTGGELPGSVYVFVRDGDHWTQQEELSAEDGAPGDRFGVSAAIEGDTALIGAFDDEHGEASGSVYVFQRSADSWGQVQKLTTSDAAAEDHFGVSVALEGDTAVVGAYCANTSAHDSGAAYVFTRDGAIWGEQAKLQPSDSGEEREFGFSVALAGKTALVGAPGDLENDDWAGAAYVFVRTATLWPEEQKLVADDAATSDFLGGSLSLQGNTALVGAPGNPGNATVKGATYVFTRSAVVWTPDHTLTPGDGAEGDRFGVSTALAGDMALAGAVEVAGAVYLFRDYGAAWTQEQKIAGHLGAPLGIATSVSGDWMVTTGVDLLSCAAGGAYLFELAPSNGTVCDDGADCGSGHCVDGFCCDAPCGGGVEDDCWVCSVALGSSRDGSCESLVGGPCNDGFFCTGTDTCSETGCDDSSGDPCASNVGDDDMDCAESCNEEADDCTADDPDRALCAHGGECLAGSCRLPGGAPCISDPECASEHCVHEVCCTEPNCALYRCGPTGACLTSCTSSNDCAPGSICNWERLCVESRTEEAADGCGCGLPGKAVPPAWASLGLFGLGVVGIGRRRRSAPSARRIRG